MKVSLFVTCLVDQFFPEVGESVVDVLERLGVQVDFPEGQTCCGQPAFNDGFHQEASSVARRFLKIFEKSEYIVAPSGSCTSMVNVFYPELFHDDPLSLEKARAIASKTYEFSEFLIKILNVKEIGAVFSGKVTYHDSCHLLRELGVRTEPRDLLTAVKGLEFVEMNRCDMCCGFGGIFSVKHAEISAAILQEKLNNIKKSGAEVVVANDSGCLMHISGGLSRQNIPVKAMHLAEILARRE